MPCNSVHTYGHENEMVSSGVSQLVNNIFPFFPIMSNELVMISKPIRALVVSWQLSYKLRKRVRSEFFLFDTLEKNQARVALKNLFWTPLVYFTTLCWGSVWLPHCKPAALLQICVYVIAYLRVLKRFLLLGQHRWAAVVVKKTKKTRTKSSSCILYRSINESHSKSCDLSGQNRF